MITMSCYQNSCALNMCFIVTFHVSLPFEHAYNNILRNVGNLTEHNTVSQPRWPGV